jgi:plastocyanin
MKRCRWLMLSVAVASAWVLGGGVLPADAQTEVALTIENNRFQPEEIKVKAGAPFVLVITNKDKGPEEFESHDLRIEKVIPGGKTVRVKIPTLKPGTYGFVGEYHAQTAKGRIVAE